MKTTPRLRPALRASVAGFTLAEVMVAVTVAMILLFGTLYSASESLAVVEEGDSRLHSVTQARSAIDRMLGDCRYASDVAVAGSPTTGWTIDITSTSVLDPANLTYVWNETNGRFTVSDGLSTETLFENVTAMDVMTETELQGAVTVITSVTVTMDIDLSGPGFQGDPGTQQTLEIGGSVKRRN